jgi:hypothetical protein
MNGAIETVYRGYRFRSRMEARWAVFFDVAGIEWQYETQGYEVDDHRYLPDFWLPESKDWVEVKGDPEGLRKDFGRMCAILGPDSPLPGFRDGKSGLIVLGEIPDATRGQILHPLLSRRDLILQRTWGMFIPQKDRASMFVADSRQSWLYRLFRKETTGDMSVDLRSSGWDVDTWTLETGGCFAKIVVAYREARQARFEHGEAGGRAA